jgi:hypothetical protein
VISKWCHHLSNTRRVQGGVIYKWRKHLLYTRLVRAAWEHRYMSRCLSVLGDAWGAVQGYFLRPKPHEAKVNAFRQAVFDIMLSKSIPQMRQRTKLLSASTFPDDFAKLLRSKSSTMLYVDLALFAVTTVKAAKRYLALYRGSPRFAAPAGTHETLHVVWEPNGLPNLVSESDAHEAQFLRDKRVFYVRTVERCKNHPDVLPYIKDYDELLCSGAVLDWMSELRKEDVQEAARAHPGDLGLVSILTGAARDAARRLAADSLAAHAKAAAEAAARVRSTERVNDNERAGMRLALLEEEDAAERGLQEVHACALAVALPKDVREIISAFVVSFDELLRAELQQRDVEFHSWTDVMRNLLSRCSTKHYFDVKLNITNSCFTLTRMEVNGDKRGDVRPLSKLVRLWHLDVEFGTMLCPCRGTLAAAVRRYLMKALKEELDKVLNPQATMD